MAVRSDASTDRYVTTSLFQLTTFTILGWFRIHASTANWQRFWDYPTPGLWQYLGCDQSVQNIIYADNVHPAGHINICPASVGTWFRTALVRTGPTATGYASAVGNALSNATQTGINALGESLYIGGGESSDEWFNGGAAAVKVYNAALTAAEVEAELAQYQPRRTTNLTNWYPLIVPETTDYSGNGNNLTAGSTETTTEDGPPIPWGSSRPRLIHIPDTGPPAVEDPPVYLRRVAPARR